MVNTTDTENTSVRKFPDAIAVLSQKIDKLTSTVESVVKSIEFCPSEIDDFEKKKHDILNKNLNLHDGRITELNPTCLRLFYWYSLIQLESN